MSTTIETTPRRDWLREELALLEEALSSSRQPVTPGLQSFALAARLGIEHDLAEIRRELSDLDGGGRIDLRLTGMPVQDHMIEAAALSEVLYPLQRLIAQLGSEAYVSSKPGSFVLEILPVPQQQLDSTSPRLDAVGETLADLVSAASKENVNDEIAAAMDDLSLDGVRAIKALVKNLKSQHLDLDLRWTNSDGFVQFGRMDRTAALVQEALELAEQNRSEYEEAGELRGITTLGKSRQFQILKSNGDTVIGVVAKDAVAMTNGYSIGEQVIATVEETERKRATGSRVTKRLLKLRRPTTS
jgi:hypothetical protein